MRQPNNRAIALLVALNILVSIIILVSMNSSKPKTDDNKAYANSLTTEEIAQRDRKEEEVKKEEDVIFEVESVTESDANVNTIPLYFSHSNDEGTFFTYLQTENPKEWDGGYWYIDYGTLSQANINPLLLKHNDEIQGVFYPSEDGDHFEIKEVLPSSESYAFEY